VGYRESSRQYLVGGKRLRSDSQLDRSEPVERRAGEQHFSARATPIIRGSTQWEYASPITPR